MYYSQIRIEPTNDQRLYVLGASWYVSDNGGKSFQNNPFTRIHGDYHALWINPANPNHLVVGSDGGIHFSYDKGKTWDYINTVPLGQFYEVGFDFRKPYWVYGGLQDNGSWGAPVFTTNLTGVSNDEWIRVGGGDGFYNVVDPKDPNTVYTESQNAGIARLNLANGEAKFIRPQPEEGSKEQYRFDWNSPIVISPHNNRRIYLGGNRLFISNDRGDNWTTITPDLSKNQDRDKLPIMNATVKPNVLSGHDGQETFGHIVTLAESPLKEGLIWLGTDDGNVQVSRDNGKTWRNVIERIGVPAQTYVSRIIASAAKEGRAYVTFDGHRGDDFKPYVFVTENYGESWQAITNNLPHAAHVIREHPRNPDLLLVGTEFGLWVSHTRGAAWWQFKSNLPTVPVDDIAIHPRENDLILATHGRSLWILDDMTALEQMSEPVAAAEAQLFQPRTATMWRYYGHKGYTGNKTYIAPNPPQGAIIAYYLRDKVKDDPKLTITDKSGAVVRELVGPNEAGVQRVVWDMRHTAPILLATNGERALSAAPVTNLMAMSGAGGPGGFALARGPRVLPGEYTVTLNVAGQTFSKTIRVEEDPRIKLTPAEHLARLQFFQAVNKLQKAAWDTQRRLGALTSEVKSLQDNLKKQPNAPDVLLKAADALAAQITTVQQRVLAPANAQAFSENAGPSEQPLVPPVLSGLGGLFGALDGYAEAPAAAHRERLQNLSAQLAALIEQVNKIIQEDVPNLNRRVAESGAPPIKAGEPLAPLQKLQ